MNFLSTQVKFSVTINTDKENDLIKILCLLAIPFMVVRQLRQDFILVVSLFLLFSVNVYSLVDFVSKVLVIHIKAYRFGLFGV